MDLALNNLQRLICHKTQQTKPTFQREVCNYVVSFNFEFWDLTEIFEFWEIVEIFEFWDLTEIFEFREIVEIFEFFSICCAMGPKGAHGAADRGVESLRFQVSIVRR